MYLKKMQFATGELGGGGKENRNVSQQSFIHHDKSVLTVFITCKISAKKEKNWFQFPEKFHFGRRGLPLGNEDEEGLEASIFFM